MEARQARQAEVVRRLELRVAELERRLGMGSRNLAGAEPAGRGWGQVWDIPPVELEKVHRLLPKLRCRACGKVTCADPPDDRAGTVTYGPNVNAAAVMLNSEGNMPVERTAMPMEALLGAQVSAGFVARAHEWLADGWSGQPSTPS